MAYPVLVDSDDDVVGEELGSVGDGLEREEGRAPRGQAQDDVHKLAHCRLIVQGPLHNTPTPNHIGPNPIGKKHMLKTASAGEAPAHKHVLS